MLSSFGCVPTNLMLSSVEYFQINSTSQFEFVPRDTEKSEFLDLVDFGGEMLS